VGADVIVVIDVLSEGVLQGFDRERDEAATDLAMFDHTRAELERLQAIAADPAEARQYLLRSSMISGLRAAAAID